ncbi:hypothetical protein STAS_23993, partial [Striga asiatica]
MELSLVNPGVVTNRCDLKVADHVFNNLDVAHKALFVESCFRPLVHIPDLKLASQIIHHLLQRTLKSSENEKNAVWFKFGEKESRFGLQEFSLVSGFKIMHDVASYEVPQKNSFLLNLFKGKRGKLTTKDFLNKFDDLVKKKEDAYFIYKLGTITVLEHVKFNSYPWGNLSYEYTVKLFTRKSFDNKKKYRDEDRAFKALPELGRKFAQTCGSGILPRILSWKMEKQLRSEQLSVFFNTSEVEAKREDLRGWLAYSPESDEIYVAWGRGRAGKIFFNDLLDDKWLSSEHVDAAIFHIRDRAIEYPLLFRQDCVILDPHFVSY